MSSEKRSELTSRRGALQLAGASLVAITGISAVDGRLDASEFSVDMVKAKAKALSLEKHVPASFDLPSWLDHLNYDEYRSIRYVTDQSLLADGPSRFRLQMFHRGSIFKRRVDVNVVKGGIVQPLAYSSTYFKSTQVDKLASLPSSLGFAGIRILWPLNSDTKFDEVISFLGASYFRFLSRGQQYGLSARGLSIGSGSPGEEFPYFREFWVREPAFDADVIAIYALLDSPSVTGCFEFELAPGTSTQLHVRATLYPRRNLSGMGVAPLTSMFFFGENTFQKPHDFRSEVHDSDGLAIHSGSGEWIWRPLRNPPSSSMSSYIDSGTHGFGLLQRDRVFRSYEDLEARYHERPSYWVDFGHAPGSGRVVLTELHARKESEDNIVACWVPDEQPVAGGESQFSYSLVSAAGPLHGGGRSVSTFESKAGVATSKGREQTIRFILDFRGGALGSKNLDVANVKLVAWASDGQVIRSSVQKNPEIAGIRATFDVELPVVGGTELRAFLRSGKDVLTETWSYRHDGID
ncbi:glucan biosynthesis protein [Labrys neptuniae]|uniref:Glucans biosynthesis protein G n=1 Tax=Labrys neptuniae TaxID=376174 RepID=A0ABV3PWF5_9HYPH